MAGKPIDTRNHKIGQDQSFDIPSVGSIDRDDFIDQFEIVGNGDGMDKAEMLSFMDENLSIRLMETTEPNAAQLVQVACNGVNQFLMRGKVQNVKRKFVEILARARTTNLSTPEYIDSNGNRATRIVKSAGLTYPFQVISDRNPKGAAWLEKILSEA